MNCPYRKDSFYYWSLYKNCSCFTAQRNSILQLAIGGEVHDMSNYKIADLFQEVVKKRSWNKYNF